MDPLKVGGETTAYCTSCKIMKDHVIVAMAAGKPAKVECMGCGKQHLYRANPPGTAKAKSGGRPAKKNSPVSIAPQEDLETRLAGADARAKQYSPKITFAIGDAVKHPQFGVGVVVMLPAKTKMEVDFRSGRKLLIHDKGGSEAPVLERRSPVSDDVPFSVPDAPPTKN